MTQDQNRKQNRLQNETWKRRLWMVGAPIVVVGVCALLKSITPAANTNAANPYVPGQQQVNAQPSSSGPVTQSRTSAQPPQTLPNGSATANDLSQVGNSANAANPFAKVSANVNGEEIQRTQLAAMCLERFGKPVIESMINRQLIEQHCKRANIQVTENDVVKEIDRLARKFGMSKEDYLKMLKQERGIMPDQYGNEIIWPTLALRRLAEQKIQPTQQEIDEAFESQYGEAIKARIIVCESMQEAQKLQAKVSQNPDEFSAVARTNSHDPSASVNGLIQPIRRHLGDKGIEQAAFQLREGQVSQVITVNMPGMKPGESGAQQFVILKCDGRLPPVKVDRESMVKTLAESIMDRKLRDEAANIYKQLEQSAKIENVYNNPALRQQYQGVAALVNGQPITTQQLAEECVLRHGHEVLESMINHQLLEHELKSHNLTVTQDDVDGEIVKAALMMGKKKQDGSPDLNGWLEMVTKESGMSQKIYIDDSVWPSVALKKLSGSVQVTEEDLKKSFEANYGRRAVCRAIVMNNMRKAQDVWAQARQVKTAKEFGKLAEENSIDPSSKSIQGQIPTIQKFGGQPMIEEVAFALQPGEISGIITMGENYVILYCEGFKEPQKVSLDDVKGMIIDDLQDKKERISMSQTFSKLRESATIDNYFAGTTHSPVKHVNDIESTDAYKSVPAGSAARQGSNRK